MIPGLHPDFWCLQIGLLHKNPLMQQISNVCNLQIR